MLRGPRSAQITGLGEAAVTGKGRVKRTELSEGRQVQAIRRPVLP